MKNKTKMNGLYKTAFILLMVCIPMFLAAIVVAYLFDKIYLSAVFSGGGAFLAFIGIIFAAVSKPKKEKKSKEDVQQPEDNNHHIEEDFQKLENSVDNN